MDRCGCGGEWRTDGQHTNEFCARCFGTRPATGHRYILREFLGGTAIKDTATDKLYGYGKGCSGFEPGDEYRVLYTKADAEAVCFMLNEREAYYS